jgi:lysophospholipid acyltransferase
MSVHHWLKYYVFMRQLDNKKRGGTAGAALVTYLVSAVWHGFYPGFTIFFFCGFLMDYHNRIGRVVLGPIFAGWCPDII